MSSAEVIGLVWRSMSQVTVAKMNRDQLEEGKKKDATQNVGR